MADFQFQNAANTTYSPTGTVAQDFSNANSTSSGVGGGSPTPNMTPAYNTDGSARFQNFTPVGTNMSSMYQTPTKKPIKSPYSINSTTLGSMTDTHAGMGGGGYSSYYSNPWMNSTANVGSNYATIQSPAGYLKGISAYGNSSDANTAEDRARFTTGQDKNAQDNTDYANGRSNTFADYIKRFNTEGVLSSLTDTNAQLGKAQQEFNSYGTSAGLLSGEQNGDVARQQNVMGAKIAGLNSLAQAYQGNLGSYLDYANKATEGVWAPKLQGITNAISFANQNQGLYNADQNAGLQKNALAYGVLGDQYKASRDDQLKARDYIANIIQNGGGNDPVIRAKISQLAQNPNLSTKDILSDPSLGKYMRPSGYLSFDPATQQFANTATGDIASGNYGNTPSGTSTEYGQAVVDSTIKMAGIDPQDAGMTINQIMQKYGAGALAKLTQAFIQQEGGTPQGENNVGNVKTETARSLGLKEGVDFTAGKKATDGGSFANFPTPEAGVSAVAKWISSRGDKPLNQAIASYKGVTATPTPASGATDWTQTSYGSVIGSAMNGVQNYSVDPSEGTGRAAAVALASRTGHTYTPDQYKWVQGQNDPTGSGVNFSLIHNSMESLSMLKDQIANIKPNTNPQAIQKILTQLGTQLNNPDLAQALQTGVLAQSDLAKVILPSGGDASERAALAVSIANGDKKVILAQIKNLADIMANTNVKTLYNEGKSKGVDDAFLKKTYLKPLVEINKKLQ